MSFLVTVAAYLFYVIAACALIGAVVTQMVFFGKIGFIGGPVDFYRSPRQLKGFLLFAALLFIGGFALVIGRSIELGRLPL
jgi:hypothetical protein